MRIVTSEAILLDAIDLHEKDRIVAFLTAEEGQKRGVARAARTKFSRFAGALRVPSRAEVEWVEKEGRDLVRLSEVRTVESWRHLHEELDALLVASYCAEQARIFAQENEPRPLLYRLLGSLFGALDRGADPDVAARYFEVWLLRLEGIFPAPESCPRCDRTLADEAVLASVEAILLCPDCGGAGSAGLRLDAPALDLLRATRKLGLEELEAAGPPPAALRSVEELCARVRRHFLGHEVRSYGVLRAMRGDRG